MRGFSDEERERIREDLRESGRELFARYGLGKTTVAEITEPVGIGTSTFYQFHDSKGDLYRAILEDEQEAIAKRIMSRSFEGTDDPGAAITGFLRASFEEIETNPLVSGSSPRTNSTGWRRSIPRPNSAPNARRNCRSFGRTSNSGKRKGGSARATRVRSRARSGRSPS
jgi:AcrR family transcriptional regulator